MNTAAIITMVTTMGIVTVFCGYFFVKILRTPNRSDTTTPTNQS